MKNIVLDRFNNGTTSIVTMSFDDGKKNDEKLIDLFDKYGIKGTFHLVSDWELLPASVYENHEVACHTVHHNYLYRMSKKGVYNEWYENRKSLENYCHKLVRGASYPQGVCSDDVIEAAKMAGIVYSRTTGSA